MSEAVEIDRGRRWDLLRLPPRLYAYFDNILYEVAMSRNTWGESVDVLRKRCAWLNVLKKRGLVFCVPSLLDKGVCYVEIAPGAWRAGSERTKNAWNRSNQVEALHRLGGDAR
jgi:hypothetical protein